MNVRFASLDPNAPRADKDCRVCIKRRIKCDRSLPSCKKCDIRRLECSGYGRKLKWCRGVASRGKLAGQSLPVVAAPDIEAETLTLTELSIGSTSERLNGQPHQNDDDEGKSGVVADKQNRNNYQLIRHRLGTDFTVSHSPSSNLLQDTKVRRLLHYYDNAIASTMVWVDSPDNPWRKIIFPLALESRVLLYSILALATEHMSARLPGNEANSTLISKDYQKKSLELLSWELGTEAQTGESATEHTQRTSPNSILATMLVLCSLEMVQANSPLWRLHLQAIRIMVQRWLPNLSDNTTRFLIKEAFVFDVLSGTTNFGEANELPSEALGVDDDTIFIEYHRLLRDVTATERRRNTSLREGRLPEPVDILALEERFEYTRMRTSSLSQKFIFSTPSLQRDFNRVIEIYHHAGLIYSYQALINRATGMPSIEYALESLFTNLQPISDSESLAQDLVWPLFIAGTEAHGKTAKQEWIEKKLANAMRNSGYSVCSQAVAFLQIFWATDHAATGTWIEFARKNTDNFPAFR